MRVGTNPNAYAPAPAKMENIVLHVITHLPDQRGYHEHRLEVIKTCFASMLNGIKLPYSLVVTDNRSVPELVKWLSSLYPTMLIHSANLGKAAQRKLVAQMLPPETILCYSDDDIFFYDNWLNPQLELLLNFPKVAAVSGYPVRTSFRWGNTNTLKWAEKNAKIETGRFIPDEWEQDFCNSIGRDYKVHKQSTLLEMDKMIVFKGMQAFATAHHCQQIGYAGVIGKALEFDGLAMGAERGFDERLDKLGLRLATIQRLARHIGNVMDDDIRKAFNQLETGNQIGANTLMEA